MNLVSHPTIAAKSMRATTGPLDHLWLPWMVHFAASGPP